MPINADEPPKRSPQVGDKVRILSGDFQNFRGVVITVDGTTASVRFVIFGRDAGTFQFPRELLTPVDTLD